MATWIYVVHLTRPASLTDPTVEEASAIQYHLERLKTLCAEGVVRLAGPALDGAFGIVILDTADEATAVSVMNEDPAVQAGVMTAELHPFHVSMERCL